MITCSMPAATASSTAYWMTGLSTRGSISLGWAFVAGRNRVPQPAAGNTALRMRMEPQLCVTLDRWPWRGGHATGGVASAQYRPGRVYPGLFPSPKDARRMVSLQSCSDRVGPRSVRGRWFDDALRLRVVGGPVRPAQTT